MAPPDAPKTRCMLLDDSLSHDRSDRCPAEVASQAFRRSDGKTQRDVKASAQREVLHSLVPNLVTGPILVDEHFEVRDHVAHRQESVVTVKVRIEA